jgi:hypothetical protein
MLTSIVNCALFAGIVLGALLLIIVCITFYKQKRFGLGGTLLSFFGVVLLGLSIWSEVEFSFGRIKFHAMKQRISELATAFDSAMEEVDHIKADQDTLMHSVERIQDNARMLFSGNVPAHVQRDITRIVERDSIIDRRFEKINEKKDMVKAGLESLLNAKKPHQEKK